MYREQEIVNKLQGRRVLIAGYGREGQSTHTLMQRVVPDTEVDIAHNDDEIYTLIEKAKRIGKPYDWVIKSPGIAMSKLERKCNLESVTSQCDIFLQIYGDQTVAITGTKGKSTTTTLLWHVLKNTIGDERKVILAGNMGVPLFDIAEQMDEQALVVCELSCHQLERIHRSAHIGIILNLYQEHLDHYRDYRDYQMAKMQLMLRQDSKDHCIYCTDSLDLAECVDELNGQIHTTLHPYCLDDALQEGIGNIESPLIGQHNISNTYAAIQAASLLGVDRVQFAKALATFEGLPHRLQKVGTFSGITFYNDSISTIPQATIAAMKALPEVETLILGGYDRGIDYGEIITLITSAPQALRNIAFVGDAGRRMLKELNLSHYGIPERLNVVNEDDYPKIVDWCFRVTSPGKICLLSPAAASYDSFKNFEERGNTFMRLVREHK